jgi:RNA polymerase sigma-70 factor (ECF subfamily)
LPRIVKAPDDAVVNRRVLSLALDQLPPGYRRVLVLHDIEGWTHEEIAETLNCSSGTSKSQLHKARRRMRQLISPPTLDKGGARGEARL